jgi:hypothetical protein
MHHARTLIAALALAACGTDKTPAEKCDDLVDTLCDRGVQCLGGSTSACVQSVQAQLPCGKATSVGPSYDRCVDELQSDSCGVLFPTDPSTGQPTIRLPADCMGVILE